MRCPYVTRWIPVVLLLGLPLLAQGQMKATLTGYVTDAQSGTPMPFANVYVNGSTRGAVTDEKGYYVLAGLPVGTVEIAVSFVGYQPAKRAIRFADAAPQRINFQLKASEQALDAVTVRGNPKSWERNLRLFKKLLFGEPFGDQCQLVNSDVLAFNEAGDHLYATATEPLVIDNQALGYRLIYALQQFDATTSGGVYYAGTTRFEELKPENERQTNRFRRNRLTAYKGSIRHLMASLCTNSFEQDGFLVYQEDATRSIPMEQRSMTLAAAVNDYKRLVPVKSSGLIQAGRLSTERRLVSPQKLIIFYTNAVSNLSPYPDARYAYTEMKLPSGQLQLTVDGVITAAEGMEAKGSMGNDRLSTMLPADWKPDGVESASVRSSSLTAQGKLLPPDISLGRITAAFNERFRWLAPTVYVHIDKPVYVTGDRLWLSAYVLDAASHQRLDDETAIHLDLLTPAGKRVQHQWVRIVDGRGEGNIRLADTLVTGIYRLRAYTDGDAAQRRPAFERSVPVYNLLRSNGSMPADSVAQSLDVQLLPEGGRWISGLPARLGVKIVQATGHGLSMAGRIVDDAGVDVARFKTNPQGMTSVSMVPSAQRTYYAEVVYTNQPQRVPLPKPELEGLVLSVDALSDTARLALIIRSTKQADSAYVLIQQRGQVIDQRKVLLQNGVANVSLPMLTWLPGLTQITLYDAAAKPQAERLVFVPEFVAPIRIIVGLNKSRYQPREPVILSVHLMDSGSPVAAALSASITDATNVPADTAEATLPTHLLLTSELRGRIENPNQYVTNRSPETRKALDDLLLTQGWRRVSGTPETDRLGGVSLMGRIVTDKQQPIPGAQLIVTSLAPRQSFMRSAGADGQGRVRLAGLTVTDTVRLLTRIADQRFKPISTKAAFLIQEEPGRGWEADKRTGVQTGYLARPQLAAAQVRQEANADLYRDKTATVLESVTVRAPKFDKRPEDIQQRSLHNEADAVIVVDEQSPVYQNLYEMIQGRLTGVTVTREGAAQARSYKVFVRGVSSFKIGMQPLYLLDGVPIQDPEGTALLTINASDIERIELLKSGGAAGIYGVRGGNGVIAFYTRSARSMQGSAKSNETLTAIQLIGYPSVQREFYVPRYDTEVADSTRSGLADLRDVLYWKPTIQTDSKGYSQLRFPLSDVVKTVRIVVQGIAADGRPVLGIQLVQVR